MAAQDETDPEGPPQGGEHFDEPPFGEHDGQEEPVRATDEDGPDDETDDETT